MQSNYTAHTSVSHTLQQRTYLHEDTIFNNIIIATPIHRFLYTRYTVPSSTTTSSSIFVFGGESMRVVWSVLRDLSAMSCFLRDMGDVSSEAGRGLYFGCVHPRELNGREDSGCGMNRWSTAFGFGVALVKRVDKNRSPKKLSGGKINHMAGFGSVYPLIRTLNGNHTRAESIRSLNGGTICKSPHLHF